jgi:iron(II)-dependent oxidoreductase
MSPSIQTAASLAYARAHTDALFRIIRPQAWYERPIPERHRNIFYLGHLEAFDWNLSRRLLGLDPFDEKFDHLFAFGIDPPVGQLPQDQPGDWPPLGEVESYVHRIRAAIDEAFPRLPPGIPDVMLEHRWMHAETFAYMLHNLPGELKSGPAPAPGSSARPPERRMIEIPAGAATLGRSRSEGFGWDNEFEQHTVHVPAFSIAKHKVTNGEYLEFVRAGAEPPHFWRLRGNQWLYRGMFGDIPLPLDWPVYVMHREASAYAGWRGASLPTEAQFHRAAYGTPAGGERPFPWGEEGPAPHRGNFDFANWDPVSVDATPQGDSGFGVSQMVGNGWEWTSTVFGPFPGFQPLPFYPGYSANFFDGEHYVMKGGSQRTAACLLRRSFRNWFRGDYPYVYSTFRLVEE